MISLRVERLFSGPGILDMRSLLPLSQDEVTVAWTNTKPEIRLLRQNSGRDFVLVVPDAAAMERAATALGIPFPVDDGFAVACIKAFDSKAGGTWRKFVADAGVNVSRGALVHVVSDFARRGHDAPPLRKLAIECVLDGVPATEVDVLLGLRMMGAKP